MTELDRTQVLETLLRIGQTFARELDPTRMIQLLTDEISALLGAPAAEFHRAVGDIARDDGLQVPVSTVSGHLFGTLWFAEPPSGPFTDEQARLARNIAAVGAVALSNARLYEEVRRQKDELERAVDRARLADRRKDEFLAMLGHELRNPLAPITTALDLMDLRDATVMARERQVIRRQVAHLSRLIDDLLDVSRIAGGKIALAREVVELATVLAKAIEMTSPLLEKRLQHLTVDVPREGLAVDADPIRLAQVFQNLLTNAAKYSDPQSEIAITARGEGDTIVVEVRDQGIGIAPELLPRLFDLFVQGERTIDRSQGGLGIGLAIARSLCELHGGTIEAASDGAGRGSRFRVTLPRAARGEPREEAPEPAQAAPGGPGMRVLVVDDNVDAAQLMQDFLASLGHQPAIAHDGISGLEVALAFRPDVAVLDIGLPVMDGYELARKLREHLASEVKLIAVTGYGQDQDRARAREAGFDHHLVKPVTLDVLVALLSQDRGS